MLQLSEILNINLENESDIKSLNEFLSTKFIDRTSDDLPYLTKPRNMVLVEIEGIDNSGKETYAKNLQKLAYDIVNRDTATKNLYNKDSYKFVYPEVISFPDYNSIAGKLLSSILRSEELQTKITNWRELYFYDFYIKMEKIYNRAHEDHETLFIIILDRYVLSNAIYSCLDKYDVKKYETQVFDLEPKTIPKFDEEGKIIQGEFETTNPIKPADGTDEFYDKLAGAIATVRDSELKQLFHSNMEVVDEVYQRLGGFIDVMVVLSVFSRDTIKEYQKGLEEKENKDLNEDFMKQIFLASFYSYITEPSAFTYYAMQIAKPIPLHCIDYKSNWNTDKFERKTLNIILSILK